MTVRATDVLMVLACLPGGLSAAEDRAAARLLGAARAAARHAADPACGPDADRPLGRDYAEQAIVPQGWEHEFVPHAGCER